MSELESGTGLGPTGSDSEPRSALGMDSVRVRTRARLTEGLGPTQNPDWNGGHMCRVRKQASFGDRLGPSEKPDRKWVWTVSELEPRSVLGPTQNPTGTGHRLCPS